MKIPPPRNEELVAPLMQYICFRKTSGSNRTWGAKIASCPGRHLTSLRPWPLLLVIKPKVLKEALQWSGERKCKATSIKPNWQANWTYNAIISHLLNDTFLRKTTDLEKTVNINWLLIQLSVITIYRRRFLAKRQAWAYDQLSALWRNTGKMQTSQESNTCICPKFPKA